MRKGKDQAQLAYPLPVREMYPELAYLLSSPVNEP